MLFTRFDFDLLDAERKKVAALAAELRAPITFPIAKNPDDYAKRPHLKFEENLTICCQDALGKFTPLRYNLLRRLAASDNGTVHVLDLLERNETLRLAPLWKDNVPVEGSLRNLASKINGDLAEYGMPWAVSYSNTHYSFILRFLPDPQAERRKYPCSLGKLFIHNSSLYNGAFPVLRPPDSPVLPNKPPFGYVQLE